LGIKVPKTIFFVTCTLNSSGTFGLFFNNIEGIKQNLRSPEGPVSVTANYIPILCTTGKQFPPLFQPYLLAG
jgi:hypothetical protein